MDLELSSNTTIEEREGKRHRNGSQVSEGGPNGDGHKRAKNGDESENDYEDENGERRRSKRRSKNDLDGRDYKCSFCTKTYLSYPALYTHMKTKHSSGSDSQQLLLNSGRGRGRPKKNAGRVTTIDPESDDYFKTLDKGGGPTDPLFYFDKIIEEFFSENSFANKAKSNNPEENKVDKPMKEEGKVEEINGEISVKEESKSEPVMQDLNNEAEESQKASNDISLNQGDIRDKNPKLVFKQFDFKLYNNFKDYPLYHILSKGKLYEEDSFNLKTEIKQEEKEEDNTPDVEMKVEEDDVEMQPEEEDNKDPIKNEEEVVKSEIPQENKDKPEQDEKEKNEEDLEENKDNPEKENGIKEEVKYGERRFDQVLKDYEALTFEQRKELNWDEVWGIYLREVSQKVNAKFYKTLLKFVILFRECWNEYGWQKIIETEKLLADEKIKVDIPVSSIPSTHKNALQQQQMIIIGDIAKKSKEGKEDFCLVNSAEWMPEVCNEFVTIFLEQREEYIDRGDAIDLTLNFCSWLYKKGHTWIKNTIKNYS